MRDPSSFLIAVVLPLLLLFIFGYGVSLDRPHDASAWSSSSRRPRADSSWPRSRLAAISTSASAPTGARSRTTWSPAASGGIVVLPADFDRELRAAPRRPRCRSSSTAATPTPRASCRTTCQGVWATGCRSAARRSRRVAARASGARAARLVQPGARQPGLPRPRVVAIIMTLIGTLLTALVVAREWERGTMEALMATPVTAVELLARQAHPLLRARHGRDDALRRSSRSGVFGVPFRGSFVALYARLVRVPLAGARAGLADLDRDQEPVSRHAVGADRAFLPAFLLSGFLFEIDTMPTPIRRSP